MAESDAKYPSDVERYQAYREERSETERQTRQREMERRAYQAMAEQADRRASERAWADRVSPRSDVPIDMPVDRQEQIRRMLESSLYDGQNPLTEMAAATVPSWDMGQKVNDPTLIVPNYNWKCSHDCKVNNMNISQNQVLETGKYTVGIYVNDELVDQVEYKVEPKVEKDPYTNYATSPFTTICLTKPISVHRGDRINWAFKKMTPKKFHQEDMLEI